MSIISVRLDFAVVARGEYSVAVAAEVDRGFAGDVKAG